MNNENLAELRQHLLDAIDIIDYMSEETIESGINTGEDSRDYDENIIDLPKDKKKDIDALLIKLSNHYNASELLYLYEELKEKGLLSK